MSRKRKNVVDYFPHTTHKDKYLIYFKKKYGKDAIVVWWELCEQMGQTENHYLDFGDDFCLETFSLDVDIVENKVLEMIDQLSKWNVIDQDLWDISKIVWMQSFVDDVEDVYTNNRKRKKPEKPVVTYTNILPSNTSENTLIRNNTSENPLSTSVNPQSKVKEIKVKEMKVKENKGDQFPDTDSSPSLIESEENSKAENNGISSHPTATEGEASTKPDDLVTRHQIRLERSVAQPTDETEIYLWYSEDWKEKFEKVSEASKTLLSGEIDNFINDIQFLLDQLNGDPLPKNLSFDERWHFQRLFQNLIRTIADRLLDEPKPEKSEKPLDISEQFEVAFGKMEKKMYRNYKN